MTTEVTKAKKVRALVEARVVAEFELDYIDRRKFDVGGLRDKTTEEMAVMLEEKCARFHEFVRDHRSQDPVRLSVERVFQDQCSDCGKPWETYTELGAELCANCGTWVSHV